MARRPWRASFLPYHLEAVPEASTPTAASSVTADEHWVATSIDTAPPWPTDRRTSVGTYNADMPTPRGDSMSPTFAGRLREEVRRHAGDAVAAERGSMGFRLIGRLASLLPSVRRRARYGLPDAAQLPRAGARCLEIGPGSGNDLVQLSRLGWDAVGLDVNPVAAREAEKVSGRPVLVGTLETKLWPDEAFALVYSSHVFEHLGQPVEAFECDDMSTKARRVSCHDISESEVRDRSQAGPTIRSRAVKVFEIVMCGIGFRVCEGLPVSAPRPVAESA